MRLCAECYNYEVPLERVYGRGFLMRLDQGPTASFKDFAARMMARMMRYFLAQEDGELVSSRRRRRHRFRSSPRVP